MLVTFNGKSFDWPLLETRYRMTRTIKPPAPRAHLDFLHPARTLWRLRLGSVRLPELEKHVLGWNRGADVMSELIPQIYFDYLRGASPEPLVPIFHHNQMDLRGLAALATSRSFPGRKSGNARTRWVRTVRRFSHLRAARRKSCARASSISVRSLSSCRRKPTGPRGDRSRAWRNAKAITRWRAVCGKECWEIRAKDSKPTSSSPSITNAAPASRIAPRSSRTRQLPNCERPTDSARLRRMRAGSIARGLKSDWRVSNGRPAAPCSTPWKANRGRLPANLIGNRREVRSDARIG